jgi:hypothetical protein
MIIGSTIQNNEAVYEGGGIVNKAGLFLINSTLSGNFAGQEGGGIFNHRSATIRNSTVTGNYAPRGGGIFNSVDIPFYGTVMLAHNLVSGNIGYPGRELFNEIETVEDTTTMGVVEADNYNLFGYSGHPGLANTEIQPLDVVPDEPLEAILDPQLADNGGPTETHGLRENSPALDIVPNEACNADPVNGVDQRGWRRNVNRVGEVSNNDCDIGAFELQDIRSVFTPVVAR